MDMQYNHGIRGSARSASGGGKFGRRIRSFSEEEEEAPAFKLLIMLGRRARLGEDPERSREGEFESLRELPLLLQPRI